MYKAKVNLSVILATGESVSFEKGKIYAKESVENVDLDNFEELDGGSILQEEIEAPIADIETAPIEEKGDEEIPVESEEEAPIADEAPAEELEG